MENSYFVYKWIEISVLISDNNLLMRPILSGFISFTLNAAQLYTPTD